LTVQSGTRYINWAIRVDRGREVDEFWGVCIVDEIFRRAEHLEKIYSEGSFEDPTSSPIKYSNGLADPPDTTDGLSIAESNLNPALVPSATRIRPLKKMVLRVMRLYYRGQVEFNAAIFHVLAAWDARLRQLLGEISEITKRWEEQTVQKLLILERRLEEQKSRDAAEMVSLRERISETEEDFIRLQESLRELQKKSSDQEVSIIDLANIVQENQKKVQQTFLDFQQDHEARMLPVQEEIAAIVKHSEFLATKVQQFGSEVQKFRSNNHNSPVLSPAMYFEFENIHRGEREEILDRQSIYLPILKRFGDKFNGTARFIDFGCGRGELLQIAYRSGIDMVGYDSNAVMVANCRSHGLKATEADFMDALASYDENSLAGVTALQFIEHLTYPQISCFFQLAAQKIRPGGCIILETINPLSIYAMRYFYMDPTHQQPVPGKTCEFLLKQHGFVDLEMLNINPVKHDPALKSLQREDPNHPLIELMFGCQDYAVIAMKP
jgi:2-polyprenyl-3-methyl-5-hydroxy-6-metoxy-1,4-benzoquinol methylase